MEGVVALLAALAHIFELDPLDLDLLEALAEDRMGTVGVAKGRDRRGRRRVCLAVGGNIACLLEGLGHLIARRHDLNAARQQRGSRCPCRSGFGPYRRRCSAAARSCSDRWDPACWRSGTSYRDAAI